MGLGRSPAMNKTEVTILGAGPAALAAAAELVSHDISVVILDENSQPGGQYFRQIPGSFQRTRPSVFDKDARDSSRSHALFQVVDHPKVTYIPDTSVWGYFSDNIVSYTGDDTSGHVSAGHIIVASGAYDRPVPFPGWTLPGVISAGGAQNLMLGQRVIPGKRVVISGNGPLNIAAGYNLDKAGAKVRSILEASKPRQIWRAVPGMLLDPLVLLKGIRYQAGLLRAGVFVKTGWTVIEARGDTQVQEVDAAPIDAHGNIDRARLRTRSVDTLIVGYGLIPSTEMTQLMGCGHIYDTNNNYVVPVRSSECETTIPDIFAVGDCTGISGVEVALLEGRLAAITIAQRLRSINQSYVKKTCVHLKSRLHRLQRFHEAMDFLFTTPRSFLSLLTDDTIVCRCEEVTAKEVRTRLKQGVTDLNTIKALTRIGMGRCQGRNCFSTLRALAAQELQVPAHKLKLPRTRAPLKPVCIGDLIRCEIPECAPPEMKQP
jgi:NADPH-dependent 2,4-dienoyl-CoA reductase/sulfur reductase-like enzyme